MQTQRGIVPTLDRVQRTLEVDISYSLSRMKVLERLPGNPIGIDVRWVDETAVALLARLRPFCRVVGLREGHEARIEEIVGWYRAAGLKPRFKMVPGHYTESLGRELARCRFFQSGFQVSVVGAPTKALPAETPIAIERVASKQAMEEYLEAYVAGWAIPEQDQAQFKVNVRPWLDQPGWSLYVGRLDGQPAAAATLYLKDGVGYLADATTHPHFRGRGLQSALLRQRISDAAVAGADLVFSGATPFSTSHRNMERAGLRTHFVRSIWTSE